MLQAAISDPHVRLIEIGASFLEARALHIVAEKRIPDLLAKEGKDGVGIEELAQKIGLEALKLGEFMRNCIEEIVWLILVIIGRIMRTLCSLHVFDEVKPDVYANNATSSALVNNEPLRAYLLLL